jgi:response regulator of citrate/malate metabolism
MDLEDLAKKLNMSILNLRKIKSALRHINKTGITPQELGAAMNLSERSARRILSQMEKKGAARIVGNRALYDKGRPRLIYKVLI